MSNLNTQQTPDPQHPADLLANPVTTSGWGPSGGGWGTTNPPPSSYGMGALASQMGGPASPPAFSLPPEVDPPLNMSNLDKKLLRKVNPETAKWVKENNYIISPVESSAFMAPVRNFITGIIIGSFIGRQALPQISLKLAALFPTGPGHRLAEAMRTRPLSMGILIFGYPLAMLGGRMGIEPSSTSIVNLQTPLGAQARFLYRTMEAEKNGQPKPMSPFAGTQNPQPAVPWGGQPPQAGQAPFVQWNSLKAQPQHQVPNSENESNFRSWDEIRKQNSDVASESSETSSDQSGNQSWGNIGQDNSRPHQDNSRPSDSSNSSTFQ